MPVANLNGLESDVPLKTANELLTRLGADSENWAWDRYKRPVWAFRGQAVASWPLASSYNRGEASEAVFRAIDIRCTGPGALVNAFDVFKRGLAESGIEIPASSPGYEFERSRPDDVPIWALGQHNGLPTPLLDWTRRPKVAAYFATVSALDRKDVTDDPIAVWALYTRIASMSTNGRSLHAHGLCDVGGQNFLSFSDEDLRFAGNLTIQTVPGWTNPNLRAQAGLFTMMMGSVGINEHIDTFVAQAKQRDLRFRLQRFTLPIAEAPKLLRLLAEEGISGASMFPGTDGVVRSMRERALWDERSF